MDRIEEIARAIHVARFNSPRGAYEPWTMDESDHEYCERLARAAYEVMARSDRQSLGASPGSRPAGQAELHRLDGSRFDPARILRLEEALAPFVGIRDQFPQSAKLITKGVDDLSPITVTVTKAQFREAVEALRDSRGYVE